MTPHVSEIRPVPVRRPTLAIDFDGVIHGYSKGWQEGRIYDPPVPGTAAALRKLSIHYILVVFTARHDLDDVHRYLVEHHMNQYIKEVTNRKPAAVAYIDDRAIRFHDWEQALEEVNEL